MRKANTSLNNIGELGNLGLCDCREWASRWRVLHSKPENKPPQTSGVLRWETLTCAKTRNACSCRGSSSSFSFYLESWISLLFFGFQACFSSHLIVASSAPSAAAAEAELMLKSDLLRLVLQQWAVVQTMTLSCLQTVWWAVSATDANFIIIAVYLSLLSLLLSLSLYHRWKPRPGTFKNWLPLPRNAGSAHFAFFVFTFIWEGFTQTQRTLRW